MGAEGEKVSKDADLELDALWKIERDIRVMARTRHIKHRDSTGKEYFLMEGIRQDELLALEARIFAIRCKEPKLIKATQIGAEHDTK